jgi:hypothetical protein
MHDRSDQLGTLLHQQLELEERLIQTLEGLNGRMAQLLDDSGLYGPSEQALETLEPLVAELRRCAAQSQAGRQRLAKLIPGEDAAGQATPGEARAGEGQAEAGRGVDRQRAGADPDPRISRWMRHAPAADAERLQSHRTRLAQRLDAAQRQLTANQVAVFYATEFHRRYLAGVLQCEQGEGNYQSDGQAFKFPPEKLIGRNC